MTTTIEELMAGLVFDMTDFIVVPAYLPDHRRGPGRLSTVPLEVVSRAAAELVLPEATVRDERELALIDPREDGELLADPAKGGGPLAGHEQDRRARLFGLTNVAFHTQHMLRTVAELLGHPLPHLLVRIGMHERRRRWGGGHYRVAARSYDPPEPGQARATGEVHLGGGNSFIPVAPDGEVYFAAPAHNLAIIYHEIGHHVVRHTADFRSNHLRPPHAQTNKKIPLDEGTSDLLAAIMLDTPDIYGWHRAAVPTWDRRRRALAPRWTMAGYEGGFSDPHADGTIWASACWTAREHVAAAGHDRVRFDRMLLHGLELSFQTHSANHLKSQADPDPTEQRTKPALTQRRYLAGLLEAMLRADPDLTDPVLAGMAAHGIHPGATNYQLRDADLAARASD
jgi:hypothetical protein